MVLLFHGFVQLLAFSVGTIWNLQLFRRGRIKMMHKCNLMATGDMQNINCGCKGIRTCLRCEAEESKQHFLQQNELVSPQHYAEKRSSWTRILRFNEPTLSIAISRDWAQPKTILHSNSDRPFFCPGFQNFANNKQSALPFKSVLTVILFLK